MANAVPNTIKLSLLNSISGHSFKCALYTSSATLTKDTTAYTATNEVSGTGYTAGGFAVTPTVQAVGDTATLAFGDVTLSNATVTARYGMIYDATDSNRAVYIFDFGSDKGVVGGTFVVDFPSAVLTVA